jgi:hypothetical protein
MSESGVLKMVRLAAAKVGTVLFRNNVAFAWVGDQVTRLEGGRVILHNPRPLHAGLIIGSSDLVGWHSVTVTPEMVGRRIAVFTGCETKKNKSGHVSRAQRNFLKKLRDAGGIAIVATSDEDFLKGLEQWMSGS